MQRPIGTAMHWRPSLMTPYVPPFTLLLTYSLDQYMFIFLTRLRYVIASKRLFFCRYPRQLLDQQSACYLHVIFIHHTSPHIWTCTGHFHIHTNFSRKTTWRPPLTMKRMQTAPMVSINGHLALLWHWIIRAGARHPLNITDCENNIYHIFICPVHISGISRLLSRFNLLALAPILLVTSSQRHPPLQSCGRTQTLMHRRCGLCPWI